MKSKLLLTLLLSFFGWNSSAQWTAVNTGITNLNVIPMAVSGINLFAGSYGGGVYVSANEGASWTAVNSGLTTSDIFSMTVSNTNIYAGTFGGGVFMSSNNGTSWTAVNNGITNFSIYGMTSMGTDVYAGTLGGGVFKSTNNGTSWTAVNTGLTNLSVVTLFVNGSDIFAGTAGGGAFISSNNGASWAAINTGLTNTTVRSFASSGSNLFAGTGGGGIFLSTNNGASWTPVNTGLTNMTVWCMRVVGTDVYAGTNNGGVFRTSNNGNSWAPVNTGLPMPADVWSLALLGTNLYAGLNGGNGVYKLPLIPSAAFNYSANQYCANASNPIASITGNPGGVFSSTVGLEFVSTATGEIDLGASTPGMYTVTYTVNGVSSTETLTIDALDDATFDYGATTVCMNGSDPIPTVSGMSGGVFSSSAGLSLNGTSGEIDLSASTPGLYDITYTTNGACPTFSMDQVMLTLVDVATSLSTETITANTSAVGATFQWLNCPSMSPISGATSSSFTASANGSYAVVVTENGCADTSACVAVTTVGLIDNSFPSNFSVYPNPTEGKITLEFESAQENLTVRIIALTGQLIHTESFFNSSNVEIELSAPGGVYILELTDNSANRNIVRIVKN